MQLNSSLDWSIIEADLKHKIHAKIKEPENKKQLYSMVYNVGLSVTELSKAEVLARRGNTTLAQSWILKINQLIEELTEFILVGALLG